MRKVIFLSLTFTASALIVACEKDAELSASKSGLHPASAPIHQTQVSNLEIPEPVSPDQMISGANWEWNGVKDPARCWPLKCDCMGYTALKALEENPETKLLVKEFEEQVKNQSIHAWYRSGRGQLVNPLPERQLKDILDGLTTYKQFPGSLDYHLVYTDAVSIEQRPNYSTTRRD